MKNISDYKAYLFDWDGTLVRTLNVWLEAKRYQLEKFGVHDVPDKDIVYKMFGRVEQGAREVGVPEDRIPEFMQEIKIIAPHVVANAALYEDVRELLETLEKDGKKLALITSSVRKVVNVVIEKHGLLEYFDVVVPADEVTKHKPDPESIYVALEKLGIAAEDALMIGDSDKDLVAANNAGVDSLLFFPDEHEVFHTREQLHELNPTYTITGWREMIALWKGAGNGRK